MNPTLLRAWPILIALLGGALLGDAAWWGSVQVRTAQAPPGLRKRDMQLPHHLAALTGNIPPDPDAWSLSFHRTLFPAPGAGMHGPTAISGTATLPEAGRLEVWPSAVEGPQGIQGMGLVLDRLGDGQAQVVQTNGLSRQAARCTGPLPAPGEAPVAFSVTPAGGGLAVTVAGISAQCSGQLPPAGPILRSGLRRVTVADLTLSGSPVPPPGPSGRTLWQVLGAALTAAFSAGLLAMAWRRRTVALCLSPLLLAGLLSGQELHAWAETARVLWLPIPWLAALAPLVICGTLTVLTGLVAVLREGAPDWGRRSTLWAGAALAPATTIVLAEGGMSLMGAVLLGIGVAIGFGLAGGDLLCLLSRALGSTSPRRTAAVFSAMGGLLALAIALTQPLGLAAIIYACLLGTLISALVWINANPRQARAYNLTAFVVACAVIGCTEVVLRFTTAGESWAGVRAGPMAFDVFSEMQDTQTEFSIFDEGKPTAYPSAGYPVQIPPSTGATRVISTGSSSTGGAYQNDDLADFYPARMQELLGDGHQVINQGVGGWTTFHIDRYLSAQIEALAPDVLTLYVGHNDQLTALPRPIKEIYEQLHSAGTKTQLSSRLSRYRMYQGLRYAVASFRPPAERVAVPLSDAEDNLTHLISLMNARGGRVVLASEGLSPDPGPLSPYFQMMSDLADAHPSVTFVDTAAALHQRPPGQVFLDDSHLTDRGHRLVAAMIAQAITGESAQ